MKEKIEKLDYVKFCTDRLNKEEGANEWLVDCREKVHSAIGILTEAQELIESIEALDSYKEGCEQNGSDPFSDHMMERLVTEAVWEAGDVLFYFTILRSEFKLSTPELNTKPNFYPATDCLRSVSTQLLELVKKYVFQNRKDLKKNILIKYNIAFNAFLAVLTDKLGVTVQEVELVNKIKLSIRYPNGKFTSELSRNRKE